MSGINLRYINLLGSRSLDDAPKVSKCSKQFLIQLRLKMPTGEKNNESEIGSNEIAASFHHVSLIATHIETLNS